MNLRFALCLVFALLQAGPAAAQRDASSWIDLTFFDVGQGDAVLVRGADGASMLVDAGRDDEIVPLLLAAGVNDLDVVVASHAHADHIGGMAAAVMAFPIGLFIDNGVPHTSRTYLDLLTTLEQRRIPYERASAGQFTLGAITARLLSPPAEGTISGDVQNNNSVGIVLELGSFRVLLSGDSEVEEINHWLEAGVPNVTILKAAHHGARDAVTPAWLAATRPELVVISCGRDNPYGHPDPWALRYYHAVAAEVRRTDLDGTVTVRGYEDGSFVVDVTGSSARE